ncbi:hypothetical protein SCLCIDRAFT_1220768 [Scleroderma citrinum Foug A]|uniref:Uncharacterized protein n=1 Tax=Scleroderma citrinum Foug A TaxID=1036808 RepID=A0A0C3D554_9AGAM|nr:hypothetical protein SCLCIDRAFT_1220768 [Scleroderma citrinum Foug A]
MHLTAWKVYFQSHLSFDLATPASGAADAFQWIHCLIKLVEAEQHPTPVQFR